MDHVFVLSPARCDGARARMLMNPAATFDLARRLRSDSGAPLGEVFSFLSGLYFRGKLTYATTFGQRSRKAPASWIITTDRGLVPPVHQVRRDDLVAFSQVDIATGDERYVAPLRRSAEQLASTIGPKTGVILLGSIATGKYADVLAGVFEDRLLFPIDYVGRGDMSRGGLLLRHVREGKELEYQPVVGATRRGKRPPKLDRQRGQ